MLVTDRDDIAERVRRLRSHGMTSLTWDRHKGHAYTYDVIDLGFNYRIDEIRSALGLVQLKKLTANNERRKVLTERYRTRLKKCRVNGLTIPFEKHSGIPAYHIFPILLPKDVNRTDFIDLMRSEKVQTSIHYPPVHQFSYYRKKYPLVSLPKTESIASREVTLPLYPAMNDADVDLVVSAVSESIIGL